MEKAIKRRFIFWQQITLWMLFVGYTGYYFCRSHFAVIKPVLLEEFGVLGLDLSTLGMISSASVGAYVAGKLILGPLSDLVGGRLVFVLGMCGSVAAGIWFGTALTVWAFTAALITNSFFQAGGWGALIRLTSQWFSYRHYGRVMGVLSLSYLFGDGLVRVLLGYLLLSGYGWRGVVLVSAAILGAAAWLMWFFLRSSPEVLNLPAPRTHPASLFSEEQRAEKNVFLTYLKSFSFYMILLMSLGLTVLRESFNQWSGTFLAQEGRMEAGDASLLSAIFPIAGGVAGIFYGYFSDWASRHRGIIVGGSQVALALLFAGVGYGYFDYHFENATAFMALTAVLLVGPYTYISGVLIMELAGRRGVSSAAGVADSVGYLGSIPAGYGIAEIAQNYDWQTVFQFLSAVAILTSVAGFLFWVRRERKIIFTRR